MKIEASATDTTPAYEVRRRANQVLDNDVTYDGLKRRIAQAMLELEMKANEIQRLHRLLASAKQDINITT